MIRVALDAMGGDLGPRIAFESAFQILSSYQDVEISLYHHDSYVPPSDQHPRLTLIACNDFIAQDELIERSLYRRKQSTLFRCLKSISDQSSDVAITLGNTGVMVALARHILGLIQPKLYPALIRELQTDPLRCLVDLGANIHCPASMLQGFSYLGAAYVETFSKDKAKVGLLNVGVESSKGSSVIQQANHLLAQRHWPVYEGYAEGYEIFKGNKNVIVCDGMVGNAVLKASEGLLSYLMSEIGSVVERGKIESLFQNKRHHGACLVGVRGNLVKGHGGSDVDALTGAIEYAVDVAKINLCERITAKILKEVIE